jgi:hypothetical protein
MNNKQIKQYVSQIVTWYAENIGGLLTLECKNIPESDLNCLAALMLSQDDDLAAEATGPDNPEFYRSLLPSMIRSLQTSKNGFESEEFRDVYNSAIRNYLIPQITQMINERLDDLNEDSGCHVKLVWNRATEKTMEIRSHG